MVVPVEDTDEARNSGEELGAVPSGLEQFSAQIVDGLDWLLAPTPIPGNDASDCEDGDQSRAAHRQGRQELGCKAYGRCRGDAAKKKDERPSHARGICCRLSVFAGLWRNGHRLVIAGLEAVC